jgi:hypothetical protein
MKNKEDVSHSYLAGYLESVIRTMHREEIDGVTINERIKFQDWLNKQIDEAYSSFHSYAKANPRGLFSKE